MQAIALSVVSFLGWGVSDATAIALFRRNDPAVITAWSGVIRIVAWILVMPFFLGDIGKISVVPVLWNILAGLSSGLGYYFIGRASRSVHPVLITSVSGGWGASAVVLGLFLFGETISILQIISVILVFLGLLISTVGVLKENEHKTIRNSGFLFAVLAFLVWGICGATLKIPAMEYGWYWSSVIMLVPYLTMVFLTDTKTLMKSGRWRIDGWVLLLIVTCCILLGDLGYNGSLALGGNIVVTGTIGGSYAVLSSLSAHFLYRERMNWIQLTGTCMTLFGIVLTAWVSSF